MLLRVLLGSAWRLAIGCRMSRRARVSGAAGGAFRHGVFAVHLALALVAVAAFLAAFAGVAATGGWAVVLLWPVLLAAPLWVWSMFLGPLLTGYYRVSREAGEKAAQERSRLAAPVLVEPDGRGGWVVPLAVWKQGPSVHVIDPTPPPAGRDALTSGSVPVRFLRRPRDTWPTLDLSGVHDGRFQKTPAWLTPDLEPFWRAPATNSYVGVKRSFRVSTDRKSPHIYDYDNGRAVYKWDYVSELTWRPLAYTREGLADFIKSLDASVLYMRYRRGLDVFDRAGRLLAPELTDDGLPIVERTKAPDGAETLLVPVPWTIGRAEVQRVTFDQGYAGPASHVQRERTLPEGRGLIGAPEVPHLWDLQLEERGSAAVISPEPAGGDNAARWRNLDAEPTR